jgi:hypothetical protein
MHVSLYHLQFIGSEGGPVGGSGNPTFAEEVVLKKSTKLNARIKLVIKANFLLSLVFLLYIDLAVKLGEQYLMIKINDNI